MRRRMAVTAALAAAMLAGPASAVLQGRDLDPTLPGYEAYYDTLQDLTWVAAGNIARSRGDHPTGLMSFAEAATWAERLVYHGIAGWRLPVNLSATPAGCIEGFTGSECGFNSHPNASEIVSLFQRDWGLVSIFSTNGEPSDKAKHFGGPSSPKVGDSYRVQGLAPGVVFEDVKDLYWSAAVLSTPVPCPVGAICDLLPIGDTAPAPIAGYWRPPGSEAYLRCLVAAQCQGDEPLPPIEANDQVVRVGSLEGRLLQPYRFSMVNGQLSYAPAADKIAYVLAVHPGDVLAVPEPSTPLLLALGLLGGVALLRGRNAKRRHWGRRSTIRQ